MADSNGGHRPKRVQEYNEGKSAASNFTAAMRAINTVPKTRIVELEKQAAKKSGK